MTRAVCAACMRPLVPNLDICVECDLAKPGPLGRRMFRYRLDGKSAQGSGVRAALASLATAARVQRFGSLSRHSTFDLIFEATDVEAQRLSGLLDRYGTQYLTLDSNEPAPTGYVVDFQRRVGAKIGIAIAVGTAGWITDIRLVPAAAAVTCVALATRVVRTDKLELELVSEKVHKTLGGVDPVVLSEARVARVRTRTPQGLELLAECLEEAARWTAIVRDKGFNLSDPFAATIDGLLARLAVALVRVASTYEQACSSVESAVYRTSSNPAELFDGYRSLRARCFELPSQLEAAMKGDKGAEQNACRLVAEVIAAAGRIVRPDATAASQGRP